MSRPSLLSDDELQAWAADHPQWDRDGDVLRITLNRPKRRNALSLEVMQEVIDALRQVHPASRVVILDAAGPAFSAGHDLGEMIDRPGDFYDELFTVCTDMMEAIHELAQPVIAKVQGIATAAGCQLVASCDLAVAADTAWFATPGVKIGLFCSTPMVALSRNVSRKHAMEMLLLGEMIAAEKAAEIGLVNRVVPPDQVMPAAMDLAATIASKAPLILKVGKEAFYRQLEMPVSEAYDYASRVMVENMLQRDAEEGIGAFIEKREPRWPD